MKIAAFSIVCFLAASQTFAQVAPEISNVQIEQRSGTKLVDITYNLKYSGAGTVTVWVNVSSDGGRSYIVPAKTFSGNIGPGVTPGNNRAIVWNAEADVDGVLIDQLRVRVMARAGNVPVPPPGMALIPGGSVQLGEWENGSSVGTITVFTSPFFMDIYEVSGGLYSDVRTWAIERGYSMSEGSFSGINHPVGSISWHDAVKWCNARSEREGLTPVYYTDATHSTVYRTGSLSLSNSFVKWTANGYRLPTEAEWEKAARGGLSGKAYPWGDTIDGSKANYQNSGDPYDNGSTPCGYYNGDQIPAGVDMANGYGLYDMAGNVREWCWDWWSSAPAGGDNPRGPATGSWRLLRGGSWTSSTINLRCAYRFGNSPGSSNYIDFGFRCARGL